MIFGSRYSASSLKMHISAILVTIVIFRKNCIFVAEGTFMEVEILHLGEVKI